MSRGVTRGDLAWGLGLLVLGLADSLSQQEYGGGQVRLALAAALQTLPLALRRTHTFLAVALSALGVLIEVAGQHPYGGVYGLVGFLLLVHATARWATGTQQWYAVGALAAGVVAHGLSEPVRSGEPLAGYASTAMPLALGAAAWAIGSWGRARAEEHQAAVDRQQVVVAEERARISRELHDVVGHALAGISLTAGAAERAPAAQDEEIRGSLELIRTLSRDAASDVRLLVGMLREESPDSPGPQPTLLELPELVARAAAAGLPVRLEERGEPRPLPGGMQLAAYRLVQEGLTNVTRHAPGADTEVVLAWTPHRLDVSVVNAAVGEPSGGPGGHGLVGLRERVSLHGGVLFAGPEEGRWVLRAGLPLP